MDEPQPGAPTGRELSEDEARREVVLQQRAERRAADAELLEQRKASRIAKTGGTSSGVEDAAETDVLLGSGTFPSNVVNARGETAQLGDIVAAAHAKSGLSVADWNALPQTARDAMLAAVMHAGGYVDAAQAGVFGVTPTPDPVPVVDAQGNPIAPSVGGDSAAELTE